VMGVRVGTSQWTLCELAASIGLSRCVVKF
jgi:hypothetical protein